MRKIVHKVVAGDTFELLSNRYFGEPSQAGKIRSQNPGVAGTLTPGTTVTILGAPESAATEVGDQGLTLRVNGTAFRYATKTTIIRSIDAFDIVEVESPYAETAEFRDLIQPFGFQSLDLSLDGTRVFRGTLIDIAPVVTPEGSTVRWGAYSLPGVLNDCTMPPSAFPLQFRNMNIADIADKIAEPFGLNVQRVGDMGGPFKRVKIKRDRTALSFLTKRARERQLLLRSNPDGDLVIAEPPALADPVATLKEDENPLEQITPRFNPQRYFSHVTVVRDNRKNLQGPQQTVLNAPAVAAGIVRPTVVTLRNVSKGEVGKAAEAASGRMLASSVSYVAQLPTWYDQSGQLWEPGSTIELTAPRAFVPSPYRFQIRKVTLTETAQGSSASLELMLPGAFGGAAPSMLPWQ